MVDGAMTTDSVRFDFDVSFPLRWVHCQFNISHFNLLSMCANSTEYFVTQYSIIPTKMLHKGIVSECQYDREVGDRMSREESDEIIRMNAVRRNLFVIYFFSLMIIN
jgi:hypothetical protein